MLSERVLTLLRSVGQLYFPFLSGSPQQALSQVSSDEFFPFSLFLSPLSRPPNLYWSLMDVPGLPIPISALGDQRSFIAKTPVLLFNPTFSFPEQRVSYVENSAQETLIEFR